MNVLCRLGSNQLFTKHCYSFNLLFIDNYITKHLKIYKVLEHSFSAYEIEDNLLIKKQQQKTFAMNSHFFKQEH